MNRNSGRIALALAIVLALALLTSACQQAAQFEITGSTSVQPLSDELVKDFMAKNLKVTINVTSGGSGAGIKAAQQGTAAIGSSSRELTSAEAGTVKEFKIARDAVAVVVNPSNTVNGLTKAQIKGIFSGATTNWKDVGGPDAPITVVTREDGSGTRSAFTELVMGTDKIKADAVVQTSTGAIKTAVSSDKNAIGYASLGSLDSTTRTLTVDGVMPSKATVTNNTYPITRPFLYLTKDAPTGAVKTFIDWVLSSEGQKVVEAQGYVPVK